MRWEAQHCGVILCPYREMLRLMPDIAPIVETFPENPYDFVWDVKVHMLMPGQYPCIPGWHYDFVPRDEEGKQDFSKIRPDKPMYLWISGHPYTEFERCGERFFIRPQEWFRFDQTDLHRGTPSDRHTWRGFIRAAHKDIAPRKDLHSHLRRHSQVYLDAENFSW